MQERDIILMLGEVKSDIKTILRGMDNFAHWQNNHELNDDRREENPARRLDRLQDKLSGLNKVAASIAIIAGGIGFGFKYIIDNIYKG